MAQTVEIHDDIIAAIAEFSDDPVGYVEFVFPWKEPGTLLADETGPDAWQLRVLQHIKDKLQAGYNKDEAMSSGIKIAVASGHGVGKTALVAWIVHWFISTREFPQIVVTANTQTQLLTKTWRELAKWNRMAIHSDWFKWSATKFYHVNYPDTWFATAIPWSANKSEAFAGTHEKFVLLIFDEACHSEDTEVLTNSGWKLFPNVLDTDKLLSMNPETHKSEYLKPARMHSYHHKGEMIEYSRAGGNFCVTPNHDMYVQGYSPGTKTNYTPWRKEKAGELNNAEYYIKKTVDWDAPHQDEFILPQFIGPHKEWPARPIDMLLWAEFLGWYISEGCATTKRTLSDGSTATYSVRITQKLGDNMDAISSLCDDIGFEYIILLSPTTPQLSIGGRQLAEYLIKYGATCKTKRIPDEIRHGSRKTISTFLDAYVLGDGYHKSNGRDILYTSSRELAGDLQELILKEGNTSRVYIRKEQSRWYADQNRYIESGINYAVSRSRTKSRINVRIKYLERINYDGMVYCAEVPPHHLLLTRRDGAVMWSGNSAVEDIIWEVAEGATTTPGTIWLVFGNPTRNTGRFRQCFGKFRRRWYTEQVNGEDAKKTDKKQLAEWKEDYGEDSDFYRVRVLGQFPRQSTTQYISGDIVEKAMGVEIESEMWLYEPKVMGIDIARSGAASTVTATRQGRKLHKMHEFRISDLAKLSDVLYERIIEENPAIVFIDVNGMGWGVYDNLKKLGHNPIPINWAMPAIKSNQFFNGRAEMWFKMKKWLSERADIPGNDTVLYDHLIGLQFGHDNKNRLQMEKKEDMMARNLDSPDRADALAMTFARQIGSKATSNKVRRRRSSSWRTIA